ncbi:MAG: hypothetical protein HRU75_14420 [Planctomycetia bacterium]|nr:MAG: hypothetical protein HRU75_14420 [Planctomycetia bacterium]
MTMHHGALPTLVSLLICDQVIDDKLSNKKSAIGMFNAVLVPQTPTTIQQMAVLASVTELTARVEMEIRLVRDADNSIIFSGRGFVEAPNPLAVVDLLFSLQGIQLPAPGQYAFEILVGGEPLGRRRFQVFVRPRRPAPPGGAEPPATTPGEPTA